MGIRKVEIRFCDSCNKELLGRLTYRTCPVCHKDICLACLEKENAKHKPRERKSKAEQPIIITLDLKEMEEGLNSEGLTLVKEPPPQPTKRTRKAGKSTGSRLPDISTFSVSVGQGDEPHILRLGEIAVGYKTLREGALDLLRTFGIDQKYVEDAPDSEGKRNLLNILNQNPTPS